MAIAIVLLCLSSFIFLDNNSAGENGLTTPGIEKALEQQPAIDLGNDQPLGIEGVEEDAPVESSEEAESNGLEGLTE